MIADILTYPFFMNALLISLLGSLAAGIVGTYIVVKRISYISGSIAHTAFGGLGIAYFAGINPLLGATGFSILSAILISVARAKERKRFDILLSAMWSVGMAIGLLFIFMTEGYASDLFTYLFGNILLTSTTDVWLVTALCAVLLTITILFFNSFRAVLFDEEFCITRNLPVFWTYLTLFLAIALSIVMLIRVVGIILCIALLTLPPATALLFNKTIRGTMIWAVIFSMIATVTGLFIGYAIDFPPGTIIILISAALYIALLGIIRFRDSMTS